MRPDDPATSTLGDELVHVDHHGQDAAVTGIALREQVGGEPTACEYGGHLHSRGCAGKVVDADGRRLRHRRRIPWAFRIVKRFALETFQLRDAELRLCGIERCRQLAGVAGCGSAGPVVPLHEV